MMQTFMSDSDVVARILTHIDEGTTDRGDEVWQEPVANYQSVDRLEQELALIKRLPTAFCPSTSLQNPGDFIARESAGTPLIVVRGRDGIVRAFENACRHRGAELADGKGCVGAFVCPYHGWSYGLDGKLIGIPHEEGFPNFDKLANGLREITAIERDGLVFIMQQPPQVCHADAIEMLSGLPEVLKSDQLVFAETETIVEANWKLHLESFLEGYHIKPAHKETFYPFGYDNLNVVEFCGPHSRITYPFRRIETLRDLAPQDYHVSDKLTYVTHLFPNVILAELSHHRTLGIIEPLNIRQTKITSYHITKSTDEGGKEAALENAERDFAFVQETGQQEDVALVTSIQRSLGSSANSVFTFGQYEPLIVQFHKELNRQLESR